MAHLEVDLVAADRTVWRGEARMLVAPSWDGDIGILPGHAPLLAVLRAGVVRVTSTSGQVESVRVDAGFLSVDADRVTVVVDHAEGAAGSPSSAGH